MKSKNRSLSSMVLLGVLILASFGFLFVKDFYNAIIYGSTTQMNGCTLFVCRFGLGISFEGNLQRTLTVKFTNPQDQSSFTIHCSGGIDGHVRIGSLYIFPFTDPHFTAISQFLPPESLCEPGSKGNAAAIIGEDNVLRGLAYSCNDESADHYLGISECFYNYEGNVHMIGFSPYNYFPTELSLTVYLPERPYTYTIKPEYEKVRINGEGCPPTCFQDNVGVYLPFPQPTPTVEVP